ncbi:kinase-like domain-containing protein [Syncephalis plumigaleata]|nr:kinase-like domain-containing protein [Syncephalis plumigaleata]
MMTYSKDISRPQSSSSSSSSLITSSMKVANTENSTETPNIGNRTITTATTTTNYCLKLRSISNDHVNAAGVPILSGSVYNSDDNNSIGTRTLRSLKQYLKRASVSQATSSMTTTPTTTPTTQTITSYLQCLLDAFGGPHAPPAETDLLEKLRCGVHIFLELDLLETWSAANNNDMSTSSLHRQSLGTALSTISSSYSSTSMSNKLSQEDMLSSLYAPNNRTSTEDEKEDMNTKTDRTIRDMRSRKMNIEDFELCYVLGRGSMGKVFLAKDRETQHHYALKCIAKHRLIEQQELYHARSERDILATLSRNQDQLFLVLDYHRGGDIAGELTRLHHFDEQRVLFYAQELVLGIAELHRLGIIYRDLKPENILIAQDGHIILTDFGLSKQFTQGNPSQKQELSRKYRGTSQCQWISNALVDHDDHNDHNDNMHHSATRLSTSSDLLNDDEDANASTDTFCGTAEYLAPEVLMGDRYSYAVDWWSLGTVLYEMLFGITPFWDDNHMIMYRRVLRETVQFPANVPEETKSFLNRLLDRNPSRRLGHGVDGVRQLKEHPFFKDTNWEDVINKQVPVPYIPSATDMDDVQHFEEEFLSMTPQLSPIAPYMRDFVSRRALDASAQICFEGFSFDERGLSNSISSMWNNHHQQQQQQQSSSTNTTTTNGDDDDDDCSL